MKKILIVPAVLAVLTAWNVSTASAASHDDYAPNRQQVQQRQNVKPTVQTDKQKQEEAKKKAEAEKKRKAEAEKKRKAEEEKKRKEEERKRKEGDRNQQNSVLKLKRTNGYDN